jgi:hypothetical protein
MQQFVALENQVGRRDTRGTKLTREVDRCSTLTARVLLTAVGSVVGRNFGMKNTWNLGRSLTASAVWSGYHAMKVAQTELNKNAHGLAQFV